MSQMSEMPQMSGGRLEVLPSSRRTTRRVLLAAALTFAALLLVVSSAWANYEQAPEHFGASGEAQQLYRSRAMAINNDGTGGVEAGSIYVAGINSRVLRFSPGSEGEAPEFREAWGWGIAEGGPSNEFVKCGPAYAEIPEGSRPPHTFAHCTLLGVRNAPGGEQVAQFNELSGVAVNQATGDVYVLNSPNPGVREKHLIEVFSATGTPIGEGFGDWGRKAPFPSEGITEGPEKLHEQSIGEEDGIAVDEAGTVFVIDRDFAGAPGTHQARIMSFEPVLAGDYEHYVYAGQGKDITTPFLSHFRRVALVGQNRLVAAGKQLIREYSTGGGSSEICSYETQGGEIDAMTTNPRTGEVFYYVVGAHGRVGRLGPCDTLTGKFEELGQEPFSPTPEAEHIYAFAFNPDLAWGPLRPKGVLYGADPQLGPSAEAKGIGDVFVPAEAQAPVVTSESVADTGSSSSTLQSQIDPRGATTSFRFQYLTRAQYEANEPDERQSLIVSATGGVFGLGFEGQGLGGEATVGVTLGSETASGLITGRGTATVHAANGTATLKGAVGTGTVIAGSAKVTAVSATEGAFSSGQGISGVGIVEGTTIEAISGNELTLSAPATGSVANTPLQAGTTGLTALATGEGVFAVGMSIKGEGIVEGTTITAVKANGLTLSKPVTKPGTAVAITAGSMTLDGLSVSEGTFVAGEPITGEGIPAGTKITGVESGSLRIDSVPTKPGTVVAVSSSGPAPLAVGEAIEGPGIPAGTTIAAIEAGQLTLSQAATSSVSEAHLHAGLPFDAPAASVRKALEGLATVGKGNVQVSGGPGDGSGSHPYDITFTGSLTNQNLPELSADGAGLSGGPATATVSTLHDGGGGFDHGAVETPVPAGALGASGVATAPVSGLTPDTAYRFRVIATSGCKGSGEPPCESIGHAASFSTYPTTPTGLPDGRAYELVSPAQKQGGEAFPADDAISSCLRECKPPGGQTFSVFPMQSAPDGDAVSYMGFPFSSSAGAAVFNSYISRRTPTGWQTTAMSPRLQENRTKLSYSESLDQGLITTEGSTPLAAGVPAGYENLYLQNAQDPADPQPLLTQALFQALSASDRLYRGVGSLVLQYGGHSSDFSAQYFEANDSLTFSGAYAPQPPDPGSVGGDLYEWREGQLALVNVLPGNTAVATGASFASASPDTNAIAEDGHRVFWKAGGHLYMREDNRTTREVHDPGSFLTASPDGLEVLLSDGCLYSLTTSSCTADLTQGHGGFLGIAGQSQDLSRIYFIDTVALPGENEREEEAEPGKPNLYLYEAGAGTRFIATLALKDGAGWAARPGLRTAEASPDGRYLAFGSEASLTGYDNVGPCAVEGQLSERHFVDVPCKEVFLYDSVAGRLTCPSWNPTGEAPLGQSTLRRLNDSEQNEWLPQPRYLTDQGRVVFDSSDRLSPRDTNGRVEDVYEDEPEEVGSCARAAGCVSLISAGTGSVDSNFLAMDENGENVFFTSRDQLVKQDTDNLLDVYDARVGGGFPGEGESALTGCRGEACQTTTTTTASPAAAVSGTSSFQGTGNVKPQARPESKSAVKVQPKAQQCPKGKVRQKGKCVKRKAKKRRKRAKKSASRTANHKHGGAK